MPTDRIIDGISLRPVLLGESKKLSRDAIFFYRDDLIYAVRVGPYKAHFITRSGNSQNNQSLIVLKVMDSIHLFTTLHHFCIMLKKIPLRNTLLILQISQISNKWSLL